jgi:hypothetical protein
MKNRIYRPIGRFFYWPILIALAVLWSAGSSMAAGPAKTTVQEMKAHMAWLVGNGNEGKMQELEQRIKRQEISLYRLGGVGAAVGGAPTIVHLALDYLKVVHR